MHLMRGLKILCLSLFLFTILTTSLLADDLTVSSPLHLGIFADLHAHDTDSPGEGKVMTNYAERLMACVEAMNAWPADLVIQLGDFVNGNFVMGAPMGDPARIVDILDQAEAIYAQVNAPRYYVLGNHDVYDLSKEEFLERVGASSLYLSFDTGGYHIVILDAQFNKKGEATQDGSCRETSRRMNSTGYKRTSRQPTSRRSSACISGSMLIFTSSPEARRSLVTRKCKRF